MKFKQLAGALGAHWVSMGYSECYQQCCCLYSNTDVGIDIDMSVIAKSIYAVVYICTNSTIVAANIIVVTVVANLGFKNVHWEYSICTKNKLENLGF